MKDYTIETFKKLSDIIKKEDSGLNLEERSLISEMMLNELSSIHCDYFKTNCPFSHYLGGAVSEWTIKCEYSEEVLKYNHRCSDKTQLDTCPYNDFYDIADSIVEEYHNQQLLKKL